MPLMARYPVSVRCPLSVPRVVRAGPAGMASRFAPRVGQRPAGWAFGSPARAAAGPAVGTALIDEVTAAHPRNNVPPSIVEKLGMNLHRQKEHPLGILRVAIQGYFEELANKNGGKPFAFFDDLHPVVRIEQNFDELLIPEDHVSRSPNDSYYVSDETMLRCHTSSHQLETLKAGHDRFLVMGDVYRRDTIDATHYPVFHQMEGVRVFEPSEWEAAGMDSTDFAEKELKETLEGPLAAGGFNVFGKRPRVPASDPDLTTSNGSGHALPPPPPPPPPMSSTAPSVAPPVPPALNFVIEAVQRRPKMEPLTAPSVALAAAAMAHHLSAPAPLVTPLLGVTEAPEPPGGVAESSAEPGSAAIARHLLPPKKRALLS